MQLSEEEVSWIRFVRAVAALPGALDASLQATAGLNFAEFYVLLHVWNSPQHTLQMSNVAEVTSMSLSRLSHLTRRLEARGLAIRTRSSVGERGVTLVTVSDAGGELLERTAPLHFTELKNTALATFTRGDIHQLAGLSQRLLDGMDA